MKVIYDNGTYLEHHGVKGMKWGVHKSKQEARKDAKEYTQAKMYYGKGAATAYYAANKHKIDSYIISKAQQKIRYAKKLGSALKGAALKIKIGYNLSKAMDQEWKL